MSLSPRQHVWGCIALLIVATIVVYFPALRGEFIFDDDLYLTEEPLIQAPDGLYRYWFTNEAVDFYPVTNSSLWLEWRLWGMDPIGYRVTNLLLHIVSALLIWRVLWKLSIPGAYLAALLFAVHPINVESVAWIAQRKGLLAILFFLLSILWYLRAEEGRGARDERSSWWTTINPGRWYWLSLLAFVLALLGKGSVAILPPVLLLIVWWRRRWIGLADIARIVPFFGVAVVGAAINVTKQTGGLREVIRHIGFAERLTGAGGTVWFYLSKAFLPIDLQMIYPLWGIHTSDWRWWLPLGTLIAVAGVLWRQRNSPRAIWVRSLLFAGGFFCVALAPVMGFADVGFMVHSLVADHYLHIALIGVVALAAAGIHYWQIRSPKAGRTTSKLAVAFVVTSLGMMTWQRCHLYIDRITLYSDSLEKNPSAWLLQNNIGIALANAGRTQEAVKHYHEGLRLNPDDPEAHNNLGLELFKQGQTQEAMELYKEALRLRFSYFEAHLNLGNALSILGKTQEALEQYQFALWIKPESAEVRYNMAKVLKQSGRLPEAIERYQQALKLKPNYPWARNNFGLALKLSGRLPEAIEQYQAAFQADPTLAEALVNLANAYAQMNRPEEAIATGEKALELARSQEKTNLAEQIEAWLKIYRADQSKAP